tara:strand:- start:1940 stop:2998 length:1059 start_codon:yes stop_codon:yes gene_type:complete
MKYNFKNSIKNLQPYLSEDRESKNEDWLKLDWNESTFALPEKIKKTLSLKVSEHLYPKNDNVELKSRIAKYNNVDEENILVYAGSDEALNDIFSVFLDHKKTCLVIVPTYTQVFTYISSNTENIILSEIDNIFDSHNLNISRDKLEASDVIYLANPNNPTGKCFPKNEIEELLINFPEKIFIIDEAYFEYSNESFIHKVDLYKNLIITRTFSKAFSLAGFRVGYVAANKEIIKILSKIKNIKSVSSYAQEAAILVLDNIKIFNNQIAEVNNSKKSLIESTKKFKRIEIIPSDANFLLIRAEDSKLLKNLFYKNKILIRDKSSEKLLKNCLRVTLGDEEIAKRILTVLKQYEK